MTVIPDLNIDKKKFRERKKQIEQKSGNRNLYPIMKNDPQFSTILLKSDLSLASLYWYVIAWEIWGNPIVGDL
jgi:hypothetical protein